MQFKPPEFLISEINSLELLQKYSFICLKVTQYSRRCSQADRTVVYEKGENSIRTEFTSPDFELNIIN